MALAEIEQQMAGVWVLQTNENLDEYLKEIGVGFVLRKLAAAASSTMTITVEGEKIRIVTKGAKNTEAFFALGEEFDNTDPQDNLVKAIATWKDGCLYTDARPVDPNKGKAQLVERRIVNENLEMKITVNDVVCKRIFKKK